MARQARISTPWRTVHRGIPWVAGFAITWLGGCAASPVGAGPGPEEGGGSEATSLPIEGFTSTRYRARWTGNDSDHDAYTFLSLDAGRPERDEFSGHLAARASADFDGQRDRDGGYVFDSLADTWSNAVTGHIYEAYVDSRHFDRLDVVRVGRQSLYETPEVLFFDGVRVDSLETTSYEVQGGAYVGVPTHFYESSPSGDRVLGAFVQARPWDRGSVRLDWMHLEDERVLREHDDDLYSLGIRHSFSDELHAEAGYTRLEERSRDLDLRGTYYEPESDLSVRVNYYRLLERQNAQAVALDPFFSALLELEPYDQIGLLAGKGLGHGIRLNGGLDVRRIRDDDDIGRFNHEFDRYYLTSNFDEIGLPDTTVSLTAEIWDSPESDIQSWSGSVTHQVSEEIEASAGSYYALYKYDLYLNDERDNVRTYYVQMEWELASGRKLTLQYDFENNDIDEFHTVKVGSTWTF